MLQKDWIRPETDSDEVKRLYAGVFYLGVDETEGGVLRGRLGHLFFRKVYPFDGLDDAVLKMDALMDSLGCLPAAEPGKPYRDACDRELPLRSRKAAAGKVCGSDNILDCGLYAPSLQETGECSADLARLRAQARELDEDGVARCDGKKLSFLVTVTGRAHGTWQGSLVQVRKNRLNPRTRFVTTLQLLRLVREAADC